MILMIYNKQVCKEFLLPNLHNVDYELILNQEIFSSRKDLKLQLENSQRGWEIVETSDYKIGNDSVQEKRHLLKHQDIIDVKTKNRDRFQIVVVDRQLFFPVWKKYDIRQMKEVSVGKSDGNIIQYRFMELISSSHMTLIHKIDGWYVDDYSRNGIFCGNSRIQGRKKLQFGDHIEMFGLHILYLGEMLAVGTFYGEISVKEDILKQVEIPEIRPEEHTEMIQKETSYFHRSPRNLPVIYQETVEIEGPPSPKVMKQKPMSSYLLHHI